MTALGIVVLIGVVEWIAIHVITLNWLEKRDGLLRPYAHDREYALKVSPPRLIWCRQCEHERAMGRRARHERWHGQRVRRASRHRRRHERHASFCKVCQHEWDHGRLLPHRRWHEGRW